MDPANARAIVNEHRDPRRVAAPAGTEVSEFHQRLAGYRPTPLHRLDIQGTVFLKDESDRFGLPAFKILGASWAVERTLRARPATHTLVAASAGNHGRAVARSAAQRSLGCRIYLPAGASRTRADLIAAEGATVVRARGGYEDAVALAERADAEDGVALVADTSLEPGGAGDAPSWVVDGYSTLFRESARQAPAPIDIVLVPCGVGSLAAAAVRWAVHEHPTAAVVGVEPVTAACVSASLAAGELVTIPTPGTSMTGLDCARPSADAWPTLTAGLSGAIAVSDAESHAAMRELAALGLTIGDCGAAPLAALRLLADRDDCASLRAATGFSPSSAVLCIATEGASDPVAYRDRMAEV
jgi:diaminopropionate ammonia-lyase